MLRRGPSAKNSSFDSSNRLALLFIPPSETIELLTDPVSPSSTLHVFSFSSCITELESGLFLDFIFDIDSSVASFKDTFSEVNTPLQHVEVVYISQLALLYRLSICFLPLYQPFPSLLRVPEPETEGAKGWMYGKTFPVYFRFTSSTKKFQVKPQWPKKCSSLRHTASWQAQILGWIGIYGPLEESQEPWSSLFLSLEVMAPNHLEPSPFH
ncbi:unnamed protein product [Lepeophtheirus salmonis]|uniref:(salmon louse) hypothetical protein n=1 Tax=Lepeophtheirus salmonis TaxID=72036 RepID=A0A7R8CKI6_LEPSM|nr:unnamed protein product [Lepeophtheirus salmonis]CAF2845776.1 unnamed protein product [Lepeophtheirus salmonis]